MAVFLSQNLCAYLHCARRGELLKLTEVAKKMPGFKAIYYLARFQHRPTFICFDGQTDRQKCYS